MGTNFNKEGELGAPERLKKNKMDQAIGGAEKRLATILIKTNCQATAQIHVQIPWPSKIKCQISSPGIILGPL